MNCGGRESIAPLYKNGGEIEALEQGLRPGACARRVARLARLARLRPAGGRYHKDTRYGRWQPF